VKPVRRAERPPLLDVVSIPLLQVAFFQGQRKEVGRDGVPVVGHKVQLVVRQFAVQVQRLRFLQARRQQENPPTQVGPVDPPERGMPQQRGEKMIVVDGGHAVNGGHVAVHQRQGLPAHDVARCNGVVKAETRRGADVLGNVHPFEAF
jgi:hypothetical protein